MTDRPTCKTCRHWAHEGDDTATMEAECRAAAPVFVHGYRLAVWPMTEHTKWCAEYESPKSLPSKPSKNACTCPRRLGIHDRVEGFCV